MKTVRSRIFFLILALCLIASGLVIFQYRTQNRMIDRYVRNVMDERVDRARSLLSINNDFYRSITHDYTYWDEMIGFIQKPDYPWAADNIRNIIEAYHANAVWIYRLNGIRIYSAADPERGDILNYDLLTPALKVRLLQEKLIRFYIRTSAGIMDVNAATVHPTNDPGRKTTPQGFMFIGKLLDSAFLAKVEKNTRCGISILYTEPREESTEMNLVSVLPLVNTGSPEPVAYIKLVGNVSGIVNFGDYYDRFFYTYVATIIFMAFAGSILLFFWIGLPLKKTAELLAREGISSHLEAKTENEFHRMTRMIREFIRQKEQILQNEEKFRKLAESTPVAIFIHDNRQILFANAAAEMMLGYSQPELKETDFLKIVHPDFLEKFRQAELDSAGEAGTIWKSESRLVSRHNEVVYVDVSTVVIGLKPSPVFLVTAHDITDRIRMEKELVVSKERAEQSDRLKSAFLSNLTHEIRTPMNSILGYSNLMRKDNVSRKELSEYAEIIVFSTTRLLKMLEDILQLSRIETDQVVLHETSFSLDLLLDEMKDHITAERDKARKKQVAIRLHRPEDAGHCSLVADIDRLRDVLQNLLDNALKYTEKGSISFGYKLFVNTIKFTVEDTGIGIPAEYKKEIFERFYQVDYANNRKFQGSGLGLTIAKAFVEIMGGKIWVESEEGSGTAFHFTLPLKTEPSQPVLVDPKPLTFDFSGSTILVVEDNLVNSRLIGAMIQAVNARVMYAYNGPMAVEMIKNIPEVNLVLMDIQMPGMDGLETTKIIRFWRPGLPVIAQSASAHAEDLKRCLEAGCAGHISKPIDTFLLYQQLAKYLNTEQEGKSA
jgi:PAS domain S-box-containing protein